MTAEDVGRLLSLISHEVRAPVGVMRGYLRLLDQHAELPDAQRQAVAAALRAGERSAEILAQVSQLARLYRRETTPALAPTRLEPLLRAVTHAVPLPPEPIITLHVGAVPDVQVNADEPLLRSALATLTLAVVRALAVDGRVYLLAREEDAGAHRGVVITMTTMEATSAAQAEAPLDVSRGGLGLELPIAQWVVEAHHGELRERRDGARFTGMVVWVPLA